MLGGDAASTVVRPLGIAVVILAAFAAFSPPALVNGAPGNNGTVKIHDGPGETEPGQVRNDPRVCSFHLHFYFADPEQAGTWEIREWAPAGDKESVALSGRYDTAGDGQDRRPASGAFSLPDGHYKLFWDGDLTKHDKMKAFWVDCAPAAESAAPSGNELPVEDSAAPSGNELPIQGSGSPNGGVEGITATPPPTDVVDVAATSGGDGWRAVLLGIAVVAGAAVLVAADRRRFGRAGGRH